MHTSQPGGSGVGVSSFTVSQNKQKKNDWCGYSQTTYNRSPARQTRLQEHPRGLKFNRTDVFDVKEEIKKRQMEAQVRNSCWEGGAQASGSKTRGKRLSAANEVLSSTDLRERLEERKNAEIEKKEVKKARGEAKKQKAHQKKQHVQNLEEAAKLAKSLKKIAELETQELEKRQKEIQKEIKKQTRTGKKELQEKENESKRELKRIEKRKKDLDKAIEQRIEQLQQQTSECCYCRQPGRQDEMIHCSGPLASRPGKNSYHARCVNLKIPFPEVFLCGACQFPTGGNREKRRRMH
jgi:DNA repair exonuclease SbcCD ATPase subunit